MTAPSPASGSPLATASLAATASLSVVVLFAPEVPGPPLVALPGFDKAVHVVVFALLTITSRWRLGRSATLLAWLAAYAGGSELVQAWWLSRRGGDVLDVAADLLGVAAAWYGANAWARGRAGSVLSTPPEATRTDL